jgi:hypothetical protein
MAIYINTLSKVVKAKLVIRQLLSGFKITSLSNIKPVLGDDTLFVASIAVVYTVPPPKKPVHSSSETSC